MEEKIKAAFEKEGFADKLLECETPEEAQKLFASEGIELSLDEVKSLGSLLEKKMDGEELSDDELDSVAGGCLSPEFFRRWGKRIKPTKPVNRFDDPHEGRNYHLHW